MRSPRELDTLGRAPEHRRSVLCLQNVYRVLLIFWIARHERQPFDLGLRDHDSIKRIAVNIWQPADNEGMRRGDI